MGDFTTLLVDIASKRRPIPALPLRAARIIGMTSTWRLQLYLCVLPALEACPRCGGSSYIGVFATLLVSIGSMGQPGFGMGLRRPPSRNRLGGAARLHHGERSFGLLTSVYMAALVPLGDFAALLVGITLEGPLTSAPPYVPPRWRQDLDVAALALSRDCATLLIGIALEG